MQKTEKHEKGIAVTKVRGVVKYCANITLPNKKRKKAYFNTKEEARAWLKTIKMSLGVDLSDIMQLTTSQLADVRKALEILPKGHSLTQIVSEYNKTIAETQINFLEAWAEYKEHRMSLNGGRLPKLRIHHFFEEFTTWQDASNVKVVLSWLKSKGKPKTIKEYRAELKQFFDYATRRGYWNKSPIDRISGADLPKVERAKISIWEIGVLKEFFEWLEAYHQDRVVWFAIACFAGIRRAEINRLKPEFFDLEHRRITLPYYTTKTGDTWLMENLPENLWRFIDSYGLEIKRMHSSYFTILTREFIDYYNRKYPDVPLQKWEQNVCRHSFCTYHLSLYRDATKTSLLLRHRNPAQMWQHYLAGLVSKETATAYFSIFPRTIPVVA